MIVGVHSYLPSHTETWVEVCRLCPFNRSKRLVTGTKISLKQYTRCGYALGLHGQDILANFPFELQTEPDLHHEHDLLRADLPHRDVLVAIAEYLVQPAIELLNRDVLQLSALNQSWNFLQERGEDASGVIVFEVSTEAGTVRGEHVVHCQEGG